MSDFPLDDGDPGPQPVDDDEAAPPYVAAPPQRSSGRVPPSNLEAEQSLLGAMLLSRDAIATAAEIVHAEDFYKPAHMHVYDAVTALYAAGEPVDPVTVAEELRRAGLLDAVGGASALISLQANTPATTSAARYARIVEELALLRRLIGAAGDISELGYSRPADVTKTVDQAESLIFSVAQRRITDTMTPLRELLDENLNRLEILYERGDEITGLPTGYGKLDELLSGLQPNALYVVGARPAMGKTAFALGMAAYAAMERSRPVLLFSLEMSRIELTQRILCAEARVDSTRMRNGKLAEADWTKISHAVGRLAEAPVWIDDNPNTTIMDIRSKARRLKGRIGDLGLVVVDYLQLMSGRSRAENRQVEIAEISRGLKILARELETPVVALSQLSRNLEQRADKRPTLSDLRESGCLTADTRIVRRDTGVEVTMGDLLAQGATDIPIWTMDEHLRLVPGHMTHVFPSGTKQVYQLRLRSGRAVKASGNHPFLRLGGWAPLDELAPGDRIAIPRSEPEPAITVPMPEAEIILLGHMIGDGCHLERHSMQYTSIDLGNVDAVAEAAQHFGVAARVVRDEPEGTTGWFQVMLPAPQRLARGKRNPIAAWLDDLGLFGRRSYQKFIPDAVFRLPRQQVALFLRHLWATDGTIAIAKGGTVGIMYSTSSPELARGLTRLLERVGVQAVVHVVQQGKHRPAHQVVVSGRDNQCRFLDVVGGHGEKAAHAASARTVLQARGDNPNRDTIPAEAWDYVRKAMPEHGVTTRALAAHLAMAYCGSALYASGVSRARLAKVAEAVPDAFLADLATSDVLWDEIVAIDELGEEQVFDATVPGTHCFIADGVIVHNSIEQDADVVMFIYRDEIYNQESPDRGKAEIIVSKHRNGPTGTIELAFLDHYTKFASMATGP